MTTIEAPPFPPSLLFFFLRLLHFASDTTPSFFFWQYNIYLWILQADSPCCISLKQRRFPSASGGMELTNTRGGAHIRVGLLDTPSLATLSISNPSIHLFFPSYFLHAFLSPLSPPFPNHNIGTHAQNIFIFGKQSTRIFHTRDISTPYLENIYYIKLTKDLERQWGGGRD